MYASSDVAGGLWPRAGTLIAQAPSVAIHKAARWTRLEKDVNAVLITAIDACERVDAQCFAADLRVTC